MRPADAHGSVPGQTGLAATEVGDAVHRLLELVELGAPAPPGRAEVEEYVRAWSPAVTAEELDRIEGFVTSYCESELARRIARLAGARPERPFAFEHDGVLLHGRLDVLWRDGPRALVLDYKTNSLAEGTPEEIVAADYRLQRLVYALACFRGGADEVEVVYHFLERPDAVVSTAFTRSDVPALEAELSAAIALIRAGDFRPTPSEFADAGSRGERVKQVAVLSDVHGNLPALEAVLAEPDVAGADLVISAGDAVAGPMPVECFDALARLGERMRFVRGNADREVVARNPEHGCDWAADRLGEERLAQIAQGPPPAAVEGHGVGPGL